MLHTVSWPANAAPSPASARPPLRFTRCRAGWVRWLLALAIWLAAATAGWLINGYVVVGPFLTFIPAIALTTVFCGRRQAAAVIALAAAACAWLWLPPAGFSMEWPNTPISLALFVLIGLFELTLVDVLYLASCDSAKRHGRLESTLRSRDVMFREMRHRIANQLHLVTAMLEGARIRIDGGAKVEPVLDQAIRRLSSLNSLQRIVDDKASYRRGLAPLLRDILDHIFHDVDVAVQVRAAPVELPDQHVAIVCMIVMEAATNASKHIFRRRRGCMFAVELRKITDARLVLTIWDDGPGFDAGSAVADSHGLGLSIMQDLAAELEGSLTLDSGSGTTVTVEFAGV
jgi:two-component sensor histidine kinase